MKLSKILGPVSLLATVYAQELTLAGVKEAFEDAGIPNDIKLNFNPKFLLEAIFPQDSGIPILVRPGIQIPRNDTAIPPMFILINPDDILNTTPAESGPFVIAAVDLDAPTRENPTNAQVRHLLAGNYAPTKIGGITITLLTNSTAAISEWRQPNPTAGNHRYVFVVFNQSPGFNQQTLVNATTPITHFDIAQFAQALGMGDPIAGTFIMVENPNSP